VHGGNPVTAVPGLTPFSLFRAVIAVPRAEIDRQVSIYAGYIFHLVAYS
jgi:hypothetical protein